MVGKLRGRVANLIGRAGTASLRFQEISFGNMTRTHIKEGKESAVCCLYVDELVQIQRGRIRLACLKRVCFAVLSVLYVSRFQGPVYGFTTLQMADFYAGKECCCHPFSCLQV